MIALLDADIVIVRAAFSAEKSVLKEVDGERVRTRHITTIKDAEFVVDQILGGIQQEYGNDVEIIPIVSGDENFRYRVYPEYKGNRNKRDKPLLIDDVTEYVMGFGGVKVPYMEADDALSILQWYGINNDVDTVICTIDKDLDQVPGHHFNIVEQAPYYVSMVEGDYNLCMQWLTGDSTDNIKGIPRVGVKTAIKILDPEFMQWPAGEPEHKVSSDMFQKVVDTYREKGLDDKYRREVKLLVGMLEYYTGVPELSSKEQSEVDKVFEEQLLPRIA